MSREQALAEAGEPDRVCRGRALSTREVFAENAFYGNDLLLKHYAGLPADRPLKVVVPHGIVFNDRYVWEAERRAPLPAVLAYSAYRARAYARETGKLPVRSAVPFAYLARLLDGAAPLPRSGTLFFPSHSSHRVTTHADYGAIADALVRLDRRFQPVTVCIYWRDHELGRHRPFLERGLPVVSAGHIFDPAFLFRLFHLCRSHHYAAGNHVGSSLLYSVLAGCRYFVLPEFAVTHSGSPEALDGDISRGGELQQALAQAFAQPGEEATARQSDLVAQVCGLDHLMAPEELRSVLLMADRLDRRGVARDPRDHRLHVRLPSSHVRRAKDLLRPGWRVMRALLGGDRGRP